MELLEIKERTDRHQREIEDLRTRVTAVETTHSVNEVHHHNVERRLAAIEDGQKWIVRLILGAIILALLGAVLQGGVSI